MGKRTPSSRRQVRRASVRRRLVVERLGDRRVLAAIAGAVFEDANVSFQRDVQESTLGNRLIYIDSNDNEAIDVGERFVVAEADGTFVFPDLEDGTYLLRLFNGTQTQQQTLPIGAVSGQTVAVAGDSLLLSGDLAISSTSGGIVLGDLSAGEGTEISVASQVTKMQPLPDGKLLVIGQDGNGETAWIVDPANDSVTAVDLAMSGQPTAWSDVAIDAAGQGVLVQRSDDVSTIYALDASSGSTGIQATTTTTTVPSDTRVLASSSGPRSVLAWSDVGGMQLSLWSNSTGSPITATPIDVEGTFEMLAFDDASGLLAMRTFDGGVTVHDVNQDFATLHNFDDITGPVAIDGARDLLMTISPVDAMLRLIDLKGGHLIADLAVDLSSIGQAVSLAVGDKADAIVVLGAAGMTEISLNKAVANRVRIEDGQSVDSVLFGVTLSGSNSVPHYQSLPELVTPEDVMLTRPAPAALLGSAGQQGATDADGDSFVLIQLGPAANGVAHVTLDGAINYSPDDDFFGSDQVPVLLHDGRDASSAIDLQIVVSPVPDPPSGVNVRPRPIPDSIPPGQPVGDIEVIDVDPQNNHVIVINDERFVVRDGKIIFVGGDIDWEIEPLIPIEVEVTDTETGTTIIEALTLSIVNPDAPIFGISPHFGMVTDDFLGDVAINTLVVETPEIDHPFELSVDDSRFVIEGVSLKLAEDQAIDFEEEREVTVNVTATNAAGNSFTQEITIGVLDVLEEDAALSLTGDSIMELEPGVEVGDVLIDGATRDDLFAFTVDDPRFEIVESQLKLIDGVVVERANQDEIQLTITATHTQTDFASITDTFIITVSDNGSPYHNDGNPYDVNRNGEITSLDALIVINYLNVYGPGPVGQGEPGYGYDVNGDGMVTALDALLILNEIARIRNGNPTVGTRGEGEGADSTPAASPNEIIAEGESANNLDTDSGDQEDAAASGLGIALNEWDRNDIRSSPTDNRDDSGQSQDEFVPDQGTASSASEFAAGVDQTLRLLSDHSG
jgi:hypothetical protein